MRWSCIAVMLAACAAPKAPQTDPARDIVAMLSHSAESWNRGDLAAFMNDYDRDSMTSYVSRGHLHRGWQALYDQYQSAYFAPGKSRDSLTFEEIDVRPLTTEVALCTARFALFRGGSVVASGPFTLILHKQGDRWLIIHDHTSADPK